MTGYGLSRAFCEFAFDNPEKIKPTHYAIYFYTIDHANSLGWKDKFGLPTRIAMEAIGIKKVDTYTAHLKDLIEWGFIEMVQKSVNQKTSNIVRLLDRAHPQKGSALGLARGRQGSEQGDGTGVGMGTVYKPLNLESYKPFNLLNFQTEKFHQQFVRRDGLSSLEHPTLSSTAVAATDVQTSITHPALAETLITFFDYQKEMGLKVNKFTVKASIEKALAMSPDDAIESINTAMSGNFTTFLAKAATSSKPSKDIPAPADSRAVDYDEQ